MYDTQALRDTNLHPGSFRQVIVDNLISRMGLGSDGNISMQIAKKKKEGMTRIRIRSDPLLRSKF